MQCINKLYLYDSALEMELLLSCTEPFIPAGDQTAFPVMI